MPLETPERHQKGPEEEEKKQGGWRKNAKPFDMGKTARRKRLLLVSAAAVMTLATLAMQVISLYLLR